MLFFYVLGADSSINLQCNQVLCLTVPVQYQCIVNDSNIIIWRIDNVMMTKLDTETYANSDDLVPFTPLTNAYK